MYLMLICLFSMLGGKYISNTAISLLQPTVPVHMLVFKTKLLRLTYSAQYIIEYTRITPWVINTFVISCYFNAHIFVQTSS